ncbi:MAG: hypothetical protein ACP5MX_00070 [Candidatus Micrarchaeia archaeon]
MATNVELQESGARVNLRYKSFLEQDIANLLASMGIGFSYDVVLRGYGQDGVSTINLDFLLDRKIGNKQVAIEAHGAQYVNEHFIRKLANFNENFSKYYSLIVVTGKKVNKFKIELNRYGISDQPCDYLIYMPQDIESYKEKYLRKEKEEGTLIAESMGELKGIISKILRI